MRQGHFIFESVLICISIVMGFLFLVNPDAFVLSALWFLVLGIMQVFHSFFIAKFYWEHPGIRKAIAWYWAGVGLDFLLLRLNTSWEVAKPIFGGTVLILPCVLALFLWFITYRYRLKKDV